MQAVAFVAGGACFLAGVAVFVALRRRAIQETQHIDREAAELDRAGSSDEEWEDAELVSPDASDRSPTLPNAATMSREQSSATLSHNSNPSTSHQHVPDVQSVTLESSYLSRTSQQHRKKKPKASVPRRSLKDRRSPPALEAFDSFRSTVPHRTASTNAHPLTPGSRRRSSERAATPQAQHTRPQKDLQDLVRMSSELREQRHVMRDQLHDHIACMSEVVNGTQGPRIPMSYSATSLHAMEDSGIGSEVTMYSPRTILPDDGSAHTIQSVPLHSPMVDEATHPRRARQGAHTRSTVESPVGHWDPSNAYRTPSASVNAPSTPMQGHGGYQTYTDLTLSSV